MAERCAACGRLITTVRASNRVITLDRVYVHFSWWANRTHTAIPEGAVNRG